MKLFIKNMVCPRCILVVGQVLKKLKLKPIRIELGYAEFESPLQAEQLTQVNKKLQQLGFELLSTHKQQQVEEIKNLLIKKLQEKKVEEHFSVKKYISSTINKDYSYLSKLFSEREQITIEYYFILLKLEKVKELMSYDELTLNEIAWNLGYSSVQHLSAQFKKVLGISTRTFKNSLEVKRKPLDQLGNSSNNL